MQSRGHIAIVDDDPSVRRSLERLLKAAGFSVESYSSATEFLHSLGAGNPGCVLLDLHMPGMDGFQLLESLRKGRSPIQVIVVTADCSAANVRRTSDLGAQRCLGKPVDSGVLIGAIEAALRATSSAATDAE